MLYSQIFTQRICLSFETSSFHAVGWLGRPISLHHRFVSFTIIIIIVAIVMSHHGDQYHYRHQNHHHCHHHQNHHHHFDQWSPTTGLAVPLTCCVLLNKRVSVPHTENLCHQLISNSLPLPGEPLSQRTLTLARFWFSILNSQRTETHFIAPVAVTIVLDFVFLMI